MSLPEAAAVVLAAVSCWWDVRSRRIPNLLTFGGAALGLAYALIARGPSGLAASAGGWLVGAAIFLPLFLLGGMGAGDVKLAACFGAWLGPSTALFVDLYSLIAGGVLAVVVALSTGYLRQAIRNVWLLLAHWRVVGVRPLPELTLEHGRGPRLPFAIPMAAGALAAIWLR
jgi:prepilin peptidase CpaA